MKNRNTLTTLGAGIGIEVDYRDDSRFGGATSPKLQESLRALFSPLHRVLRQKGPEYLVRQGPQLLDDLSGSPAFAEIRTRRGLSKNVLYPNPRAIAPESIVLSSEDEQTRLPVDKLAMPELHDIIADLAMGVRAPVNCTSAFLQSFLHCTSTQSAPSIKAPGADIIYAGHNTVAVRTRKAQVVVDPWFFPQSNRYPSGYQPIMRRELGNVDCVAITHSHPDHFHPGTLLQFHRDTHIVVPRVPRESILSLQMADRLRELGFRRITELDWWSSIKVGDISLSAAPFYGEQPTVHDQLNPEIRNHGNCYVIRTPQVSCALVADCGRDREGSVAQVALEAWRRWGPVDVLFSGFRGWNLYPIQYFESSVRQYLLFVPPSLYGVRQSIMSNVDEAVDTAEAWHAHYLVPYADGGAPWFSDIGLGPKFGPTGVSREGEWAGFDELPESCLDALRRRSTPIPGVQASSAVEAMLLRPGDAVSFARKKPSVIRPEAHGWPWDVAA